MTSATRKKLLLAYTIVVAVSAVIMLLVAIPTSAKTMRGRPWDGKVDWIAARAWWDGKDPYSPQELHRVALDGLGHPPTTAFWSLPFGLMPLEEMSPVLGDIVMFLLLAQLIVIGFELKLPSPPWTA